jgi:hypothetical protein
MDRYVPEHTVYQPVQKTVVRQKTPQGYLVVNTVKWRNWLIYFLFAVIACLGVYIAYLHLFEKRDQCAEKRDPCADCKIDTPVGEMSCSFLGTVIKTMKQNPGNSAMARLSQSGSQAPSGLIATNAANGDPGYYSPLQAAQTNPEQAALTRLNFPTS